MVVFVGLAVTDSRCDDVTLAKRGPVVDGDYTDLIGRSVDHHGSETALLSYLLRDMLDRSYLVSTANRMVVDFSWPADHDELGKVDRVSSLTEDCSLWTLLSTGF